MDGVLLACAGLSCRLTFRGGVGFKNYAARQPQNTAGKQSSESLDRQSSLLYVHVTLRATLHEQGTLTLATTENVEGE